MVTNPLNSFFPEQVKHITIFKLWMVGLVLGKEGFLHADDLYTFLSYFSVDLICFPVQATKFSDVLSGPHVVQWEGQSLSFFFCHGRTALGIYALLSCLLPSGFFSTGLW